MDAAIELRGVGKRYSKVDERRALLRSVLPFGGPDRRELWALRGIDLVVEDGEIVGILGGNGAGKTTLLRLLAGVSRPTEGRVSVRGRIAPLISIGVGFHPEMSGRENVLVNGLMLGLSEKQVRDRFDQIVDFAELEEFIDTPVKVYSSGMLMRLGFSVLMHTNPEVLLIDEILAVGDAGFHAKSFERLSTLHAQGATIVMVSHSMHMLRQLCRRGIVMRDGRIQHDGDIENAIALHCGTMSKLDDPGQQQTVVDVVERRLVGGEDENHHAHYDAPIEMQLRLRFYRDVPECTISFVIVGAMGTPVTSFASPMHRERSFGAGEDVEATIRFRARLGGGTTSWLFASTPAMANCSVAPRASFCLSPAVPVPWGRSIYARPSKSTVSIARIGARRSWRRRRIRAGPSCPRAARVVTGSEIIPARDPPPAARSAGSPASASDIRCDRATGAGARAGEDPLRHLSDEDRLIVARAAPYTMTGVPRLTALVDSVRYCLRRNIPGAFAECGVWRGGSVLAMILTLQELGVNDRHIHLYDTFEGMTKPTAHDVSISGSSALEDWADAQAKDEVLDGHLFGPHSFDESSVRELLAETGYPAELIHVVRGPVEETIPSRAPDALALLRLDTDWYESTRHELNHLYPRLAVGGVLLIDDYGHWEGARRAVDEYFASEAEPLLLNRIDYTGRVAIKH